MIVVFTGPSLPPAEVPALAGLRVLPPVAQGDVYRAARERPWGIGIIDGVFERVPAVWHKEILWALSEGVHVFGAASMGALRAAELAAFGMVGVGRIFEQFRDGALDADDEVALAHLDDAHGYRRVSEALVDMRATLAAAVAADVVPPALAARLIAIARGHFYPERSWPVVLAAVRGEIGATPDLPELAPHDRISDARTALDGFERWLPGGRVDQKRRDALALIDAMREARDRCPGPFAARFAFEHTDLWERAVQGLRATGDAARAPVDDHALLDELRLSGDERLYDLATAEALCRALADDVAARHGREDDLELLQRTAVAFRRRHGLHAGTAMATWLAEAELAPDAFFAMMAREARHQWAEAVFAPEAVRYLSDPLRALGVYRRLCTRARAKQAALTRAERSPEAVDDASDATALWRWYFARLGRPVPADLGAHARRFGFADAGALRRAVQLERWYVDEVEGRSAQVTS